LVVNTLGLIFDGLNDSESLIETLKDLGKSHVKFGVLPEHYPILG